MRKGIEHELNIEKFLEEPAGRDRRLDYIRELYLSGDTEQAEWMFGRLYQRMIMTKGKIGKKKTRELDWLDRVRKSGPPDPK